MHVSQQNKIKLNRKHHAPEKPYPIKVVQFGEGNFLRAFANYAIQILNETTDFNGSVVVVQPREIDKLFSLNQQEGLFTFFTNGIKNGQKIQEVKLITNVVKGINTYTNFKEYLQLAHIDSLEFVISNTTEAGIEFIETDTLEMQPPKSFPAKLTVLLYERFKYFNGDASKGLAIIPCELINYNADTLKEIIVKYANLWQLESSFLQWLEHSCTFHNTLVDRIVPGYPRNEIETYNHQLDYHDDILVTAEPFFLWVIEGDEKLKAKLPFEKTNLDVKIVKDMQPYRTRKVRILNGAHTAMVPFSILYGNETVKETLENSFTGNFVSQVIFEEINPTLNMDKTELNQFAEEVLDRFRNPFIKHLLSDIALNSISKFKVRVLPSMLEYIKINQKLPPYLTFSMACTIRFYKKEWQGTVLPIKDAFDVVTFFEKLWQTNNFNEVVTKTLANLDFWEQDLNQVNGLNEALVFALTVIETNGIEQGLKNFLTKY